MRYRDTEFDKIDVERDIPFAGALDYSGNEVTLCLDVYKPAEDAKGLLPVLVFVHGGGFRTGNDKSQRYIVALAERFAARGYACVSVDYRVRTPEQDAEGAVDDAADDLNHAIMWLGANGAAHGLDASRMAMVGGSAGGMAIARLFLHRDGFRQQGVRALTLLWGAPKPDWLTPTDTCAPPPVLFFHGDCDQLVPFENALSLDRLLTSRLDEHTFIPLRGARHTCMDYANCFEGAMTAFFMWHLLS